MHRIAGILDFVKWLPVLIIMAAFCGCRSASPEKVAESRPGPASMSGEFLLDLPEEELREAGGASALPKFSFKADGTWTMNTPGEPPTSGNYKLAGSKLTLTSSSDPPEQIDFEVETGGNAILEISEEPRADWTRFVLAKESGK